ncbi:MAG: biotin/lipoyl-binding protein, partial [Bacteroidota bacterium]
MRKKLVVAGIVIVVLIGGGFLLFGGPSNSELDALPTVKVVRGNIVDKALAVGTVEPENEISVKSKVSGVVSRIFADAGDYVDAGDPLLEVKPDPTPLELAEAKRRVQLQEVEMENLS